LETNTSFQYLKFNKEMFAWLREKNHWIMLHTLTTNFTSPIGFILGMHPTLSSHDAMKELLDGVLPDIEFNLIMTSQFYITPQGTKVNTNVVELLVAADEASRACENLSKAWLDTQFVEELDNRSVGMPMEFIPMIKKGVMEVSTFRECLRRQTEFAKSTIAISVDVYPLLRHWIRGPQTGSIDELWTPDDPLDFENTSWTAAVEWQAIFEALIKHGEEHFSQAMNTPFATGPVADLIGPFEFNEYSQQILHGEFDIDSISDDIQL
jgi:hypothetical protein